jgi:hypothetical protein
MGCGALHCDPLAWQHADIELSGQDLPQGHILA